MLSFKYGTSTDYVMIDRNMTWGNANGSFQRLVDMDGSYLINIYHFVRKRLSMKQFQGFDERLLCVIEELLSERGIDIKKYPTFLPYQLDDGVWMFNGNPATEEQVLAHKLGLPVKEVEECA
jgi:hypothetical protein